MWWIIGGVAQTLGLLLFWWIGWKMGWMFGSQMTETKVINDVIKRPSAENFTMLDRLFADRKAMYNPSWDVLDLRIEKREPRQLIEDPICHRNHKAKLGKVPGSDFDCLVKDIPCIYPHCTCPNETASKSCPANEILWEFTPKQPDQSGLL